MAGIIEEQHAERCRLFMQWKKMDWPILVDSLNRLEVTAIPITLLIDEWGIVRKVQARPADLEEFLRQDFAQPEGYAVPNSTKPDLSRLPQKPESALSEEAIGVALYEWGGMQRIDECIERFGRSVAMDPGNASALFRLGVAHRRRYESEYRRTEDFQQAVRYWGKALSIDPNQYIWRRRIQQYGPRLDKPYSFYDWVRQARAEIQDRGEHPVPLTVEPNGAEFALPLKQDVARETGEVQPDAQGRITRDERPLIRAEYTVVPATTGARPLFRVHVVFQPDDAFKAHWNNEADAMAFWIDPPQGWTVDAQRHDWPNPPSPVSREARRAEFEFKGPVEARGDTVTIRGYALYSVCEEVDGMCLYRRQDLILRVSAQ